MLKNSIIEKRKLKETSEVQSIVFNKSLFSKNEAIVWLKTHEYKYGGVDEKENSWRFRQEDPEKYKRIISKKIDRGIVLVIGYL